MPMKPGVRFTWENAVVNSEFNFVNCTTLYNGLQTGLPWIRHLHGDGYFGSSWVHKKNSVG